MSGSLGMGYGYNRSSTDAVSNSSSYGYTGSTSGDTSRSFSSGMSEGTSQSQSGQTIAFEDLFKQLYGNASGAADSVAMQAPELKAAASQLFTGGSQFLQTLGGNAGTHYMDERLTGASPVEDIIASMKTDAASLFTDELNPAIISRAVAGGTLGGGRQGVAQGVAQAKVANDFTRNAAALRYSDVQQKDQIAQTVAGNSIAAASTGLGALPGMLDLLERGQNAELAPYASLANILGGPTTLTESSSSATDFSRNTAQSAADAFSRSFGEQSATSSATQRSRGRGRNYSYDSSFAIGGMGGG